MCSDRKAVSSTVSFQGKLLKGARNQGEWWKERFPGNLKNRFVFCFDMSNSCICGVIKGPQCQHTRGSLFSNYGEVVERHTCWYYFSSPLRRDPQVNEAVETGLDNLKGPLYPDPAFTQRHINEALWWSLGVRIGRTGCRHILCSPR